MDGSMYTTGAYLEANQTWHAEDAPWKAAQIAGIMARNALSPSTITEIGCGSGAILGELSANTAFAKTVFTGYDISPQALAIASRFSSDRVCFKCADMLQEKPNPVDVLLVIDVFEHVPDYLGFVSQCRSLATYKIYHIPLDIHASAVLRDTFDRGRASLGHIHVFTASTALATLRDTGHEVIDFCYTDGAFGLFRQHPSARRAVANVPRWILSKFSIPFTARLLGGYSLLVLAK